MKVDKKHNQKPTAVGINTDKTGTRIDSLYLTRMTNFQTVEVLNWVITRVPDGWIYQPKCGGEIQYVAGTFVPDVDDSRKVQQVEIIQGDYPIQVSLSSR